MTTTFPDQYHFNSKGYHDPSYLRVLPTKEKQTRSKAAEDAEAAMQGYYVPDDDNHEEETAEQEDGPEIFGDIDKISENQKTVLLKLKDAYIHPRIKVKRIALSFSGASVFFLSPIRKDGTPMPSSVLKFDKKAEVEDEIQKTKKYGELFGLTTPKVKDSQFLKDADPEDPCAVMQIDLCGGIFGLPEFASAPPVLTFANVIEQELKTNERKVDVVPIVNEALERRMHAFTMSSRSVQEVNLTAMYKLVRFVGHGVLNRAKEGAERGKKSPALAAGFLNPPDIDSLDPSGAFIKELTGSRKTVKDFFKNFCAQESTFNAKFTRKVVLGLCHNDLHGGNLLLDSQGLVWLIDFATVKNNVHVLMDLTKFMASCLFLYLGENIGEDYVHMFAKLLATTPDATTALPLVGGEDLKKDMTATFVLELLSRIRHCMCIYEIGDDAPTNDGIPFAIAMFSWSTRMLSYSEPSLFQKTRALYFALVGAHRVMWEAGINIGSTANAWIDQFRLVWEGQKGRRLSTSATQVQTVQFQFDVEYPRYLAQVGTAEAWSTDFLTREKVHVTDHCIAVTVEFSGRIFPRYISLPTQMKVVIGKLGRIFNAYLPEILRLARFQGRLLIIGDSGSGKTMLTKQLFSEVAQEQLVKIYGEQEGGRIALDETQKQEAAAGDRDPISIVPLRVPLIDLGRQLEAEPDTILEADPVNDLLTGWVQRKYGQDSVPYKLITDVRHSCISQDSGRRSSVHSGIDEDEPEAGTGSVNSAESGAGMYDVSEASCLFVLLDGFDEASSFKTAVLEYLQSFLTNETAHMVFLTSRPGSVEANHTQILMDLGFNSFQMGKLQADQAKSISSTTLERMQEPRDLIDAVNEDILNSGYKTLIENPLILTLLIHVLRKSRSQLKEKLAQTETAVATTDDEANMHQEVMKKTEVYQRAVKLILHQSDAAKFVLRDGRSDQAMVRRLEMLKTVRARKLFQQVSWAGHNDRARAFTWSGIRKTSTDEEMISVMQEAFEQGRMPIFEKVEALGSEPMFQLTHLSFQELMTGEYASAIVRHAHASGTTRQYMNSFLSNSSANIDRDRLSEQWWVQVWFHICEMLQPEAFEAWLAILSEDERLKVKENTITYRKDFDFTPTFYLMKTCVRPWERNGCPCLCYDIDYEEGTCFMKHVYANCSIKFSWKTRDKILSRGRSPTMEALIYFLGAAVVFRQACRTPYTSVVYEMCKRAVHPGLVDDRGMSAFWIAGCENHQSCVKCMMDYKAQAAFHKTLTFDQSIGYYYYPYNQTSFVVANDYTASQNMMKVAKPYGILEQAKEGTLSLKPEVDPDFADPATGMTLLHYAAAGGHAKLVEELIKRGATIDAVNSEGTTPLGMAVEYCRKDSAVEVMELLLEARADVAHKDTRQSADAPWLENFFGHGNPLGVAPVLHSEPEKLKTLLKYGYDLSWENDDGWIPICMAGLPHNADMLRLLLESKSPFTEHKIGYHPHGHDNPKHVLKQWNSIAAPTRYLNHQCMSIAKWCTKYGSDFYNVAFEHGYNMNHDNIQFLEQEWTMSSLMWCSFMGAELLLKEDTTSLYWHKDQGHDFSTMGHPKHKLTMFWYFAQIVANGAAIRFQLDNGIDHTGKSGPMGLLGRPAQVAKFVQNQPFLDAYNDWLMLQEEEKRGKKVPSNV